MTTTGRTLRRRAVQGLAALSAVGALAACGAAPMGTGSAQNLPPGTRLFAQRPQSPDCSRVDLRALSDLSLDPVPKPDSGTWRPQADHPDRTWSRCMGVDSTGDAAFTDASGAGADGSAPQLIWWVGVANSREASAAAEPLGVSRPGAARVLRRQAQLGGATAEALMVVSGDDDHATSVLVALNDPATGHPGAKCLVRSVSGAEADRAVDWCLQTMSDQLLSG